MPPSYKPVSGREMSSLMCGVHTIDRTTPMATTRIGPKMLIRGKAQKTASTRRMVNAHLKMILAGSSARLSARMVSQMRQAKPAIDKATSTEIVTAWLMNKTQIRLLRRFAGYDPDAARG